MMMMHLLACLHSKDVAPPIGPAASLAARPAWSQGSGYAPGLSHDLLLSLGAKGDLQTHAGPLEGGLLVCEVTTSHRGDRARYFAARRGIDTSLPDTDVWLDVGGQGVTTHGAIDSATTRFAAPAVHLKSGDPLRASLMDRGILRRHTYDTLSGTYEGALPMPLQGGTGEGWCGLAPPERVEAALAPHLAGADVAQVSLEARSTDLSRADYGRASSDDPRVPLRDAAALVGWERAEVAERVARVDDAEAAFSEAVKQALAAARRDMPDALTIGGATVKVRAVECPWLGYSRYGVRSRCAMEVELRADPAGEVWLEWVDEDGAPTPLDGGFSWVVSPDADKQTEAVQQEVLPGQEALLIAPVPPDRPPVAIRAWRGEQSFWIAVPEPGR